MVKSTKAKSMVRGSSHNEITEAQIRIILDRGTEIFKKKKNTRSQY